MFPRAPPIGFEGLLEKSSSNFIGFEHYEKDSLQTTLYPTEDAMPIPSPPFMRDVTPSPRTRNLHRSSTVKKVFSTHELFAIYQEMSNFWFKEEWITFIDQSREISLTLLCNTNEMLSLQTVIDENLLVTGDLSLQFPPECFLIRTTKKTPALIRPNARLSLRNLCRSINDEQIDSYRLLAIVCQHKELNSKLMFYKDHRWNSWYVYYDQSTHSPAHSNLLSDDQTQQLQSFVETSHVNRLTFTSLPLSALNHHPITFVYLPELHK